jgi:hypothetical protein
VLNLPELLHNKESIGLDAIESVALMDRFDSKFVVPVDWLTSVVTELHEHRVLTIEGHTSTKYNNLYFDTENARCLEDHTRGRNSRFKIRIRHYDNTGMAFLEVKRRDVYGKTTKERLVRSNARAWNAPLSEHEKAFLAKLVPYADELKPTLQSAFERFTLVHLESGERITFDQNLAYVKPEISADSHAWARPIPHLAVVEWKQSTVNHQGSLIQSFRRQPGRRGPLGRALRVSKFVLGNAVTTPHHPLRTYRSALRDLKRAEHYAANPTFALESLLR